MPETCASCECIAQPLDDDERGQEVERRIRAFNACCVSCVRTELLATALSYRHRVGTEEAVAVLEEVATMLRQTDRTPRVTN